MLVARALTRWVLRPLNGLERAVAEMTEGVAGPPADVAGPPELRHFTSAFNTMAQVVRASLDRQRRLVADASHQLRNPLAAVRLRADSLEDHVAEAGRSTYGSMSAELDRLENLPAPTAPPGPRGGGQRQPQGGSVDRRSRVDGPRGRDRGTHGVLAARSRWPKSATAHPPDHPGLAVSLDRHDVEQLLDVALDNALRCWPPAASAANPADACAWPRASGAGCIWRSRSLWRNRSRPAIRTSAWTRYRRRAVSTTSPACARGTLIWDSRWPTLPSGIGPLAQSQPHL